MGMAGLGHLMHGHYEAQREIILRRISGADRQFLQLLDELPTNELKILEHHPDLIDAIRDLSHGTLSELRSLLENQHKLEIEGTSIDGYYIDTAKLDDYWPEEASPEEVGYNSWWIEWKDLLFWMKNFLLEEVRINIFFRYIEYKTKLRTHSQFI